jgi:hypothetical protein
MLSNKQAVSGYTKDIGGDKASQNESVSTTNGGIVYLRK